MIYLAYIAVAIVIFFLVVVFGIITVTAVKIHYHWKKIGRSPRSNQIKQKPETFTQDKEFF